MITPGEAAKLLKRMSPMPAETPAPRMQGRDTGRQFLEDYDRIQRELMLAHDEIATLKEQLVEVTARNGILESNTESYKQMAAEERRRANVWLSYTMKLSGGDEAIEAIMAARKAIALTAAQEAAARGLSEQMTPEEEAQVKRIAGAAQPGGQLPQNQI